MRVLRAVPYLAAVFGNVRDTVVARVLTNTRQMSRNGNTKAKVCRGDAAGAACWMPPDGRRLRRRLCKRKTEKGFLKEEVVFFEC